jgi:DNA primase (bacterial type)
MNAKQAKLIKLTSLMNSLGFQKIKEERGGQEYKYLSPFREEKEPSFNINIAKNAWFDFGAGEGGNTLDFAIKYLQNRGKPSQISDALSWLENISGQYRKNPITRSHSKTDLSSFSKQAAQPHFLEESSELEFISAKKISHSRILSYLTKERAISEDLIHPYLKEIRYKNRKTDKVFFAFGMQNRAGGWEIRSASDEYPFKSALNGRDITYFNKNRSTVIVFEGMIDFLSALALDFKSLNNKDAVILHSLSSFSQACEVIDQHNYSEVKTYLDNDESGERYTQLFKDEYGDRLIPMNTTYEGHKDINNYLVGKL